MGAPGMKNKIHITLKRHQQFLYLRSLPYYKIENSGSNKLLILEYCDIFSRYCIVCVGVVFKPRQIDGGVDSGDGSSHIASVNTIC